MTKPNGDYSVTLPKPTTTGPATVTLIATVEEAVRKNKGESSQGQEEGPQEGQGQEVQLPRGYGADRAHGQLAKASTSQPSERPALRGPLVVLRAEEAIACTALRILISAAGRGARDLFL